MPRVLQGLPHLLLCGRTDHPARRAHDHAPRRDPLSRRDQRPRADDGAGAHDAVVQHHGPHADQAPVLHHAAVEDGAVPHHHVLPHLGGDAGGAVEGAVVLDIAARTDADGAHVPPKNRAVPDGHILPQGYVPDEGRALLRPGGGRDGGGLSRRCSYEHRLPPCEYRFCVGRRPRLHL